MNTILDYAYGSRALAAYIILGTLLAMSRSFTVEPNSQSSHAVAIINGREISRQQFEAAVQRSGVVTAEGRRALLNYMVDEELLVQHAVEIGLLDTHPRLRKLVVRRDIDATEGASTPLEPSMGDVEHFYKTRAPLFAHPKRFQVEGLMLPKRGDALREQDQLELAKTLLMSGRAAEAVAAITSMTIDKTLPVTAVTASGLAQVVGAQEAEEIMHLTPGQITAPILKDGTYYVFRLAEVLSAEETTFSDAYPQVLLELRGERAEWALQERITDRRGSTSIEVAPSFR
jgi:hypothetical protein